VLTGAATVRRIVLALWLTLAAVILGRGAYDKYVYGAMAHMSGDLGWPPCPVSLSLTGVIVPGAAGDAELRDDQGVMHPLVWGTHNTAVVDWNRRYSIGGKWFDAVGGTFWACAGAHAVIPE
jgi:hypothetical protein